MDRIGKYIVLEEIGHGGMGIVYRARDPIIGREVAVKVIIERIMRSPQLRERFLREIASAGRLSHENIMTIYDAGDHEERPYFVMELLSGTDLSTVIRQRTLSLDEKLDIAQQVARGLCYAHGRGVIHRDIKPDNVRILDNGRAKIMDFGIARVESATRTPTNSTIGTPRYMSPEQIKGEHIDRRTDIFSFGALLYELLTGRPPFAGERITTVIYKILHETPPPVDLGDVPGADALRHFVERCLEKDLEVRYADFDEVLDALGAIVAARHSVAPTATKVPPASVERAEDATTGAEEAKEREAPPPKASTEPVPDDETVVLGEVDDEPWPVAAASRSAEAKAPSGGRALPVPKLVLGGIGMLVVLGLAYVIAQPGGAPDEPEEEAVVATADSPAAQPFAPSEEPDSLGAALPVDESEAGPDEAGGEALAEARRQAEARRSQMRTAKGRAADAEDQPTYEQALAQERAGDTAFRRGTAAGYSSAQSAYTEAARLFGQAQAAADQAAADRIASAQRQRAERAQQAMNEARADVVEHRTDPRIAADFERAETHRSTAERQFRDGDFNGAVASFSEARTIYAAAAQTAAQPPSERAADPEPTTEPEPEEPSPTERAQAAAERTAGAAAARLKQALEQENASAMRAVHGAYDGWDGFFRHADNVRASVNVQSVEASGTTATADVSLRIQFRNTSKNEDETTNIRYGWTLEQRGDAWALTSVAVR